MPLSRGSALFGFLENRRRVVRRPDQADGHIFHTKDLLQPGIGNEDVRAVTVEIAKLTHVLQDRPVLQPVARQQPHGALQGLRTAQSGNFIQKEQHRASQAPCGALRDHECPGEGRRGIWGLCGYLNIPRDVLKDLGDQKDGGEV